MLRSGKAESAGTKPLWPNIDASVHHLSSAIWSFQVRLALGVPISLAQAPRAFCVPEPHMSRSRLTRALIGLKQRSCWNPPSLTNKTRTWTEDRKVLRTQRLTSHDCDWSHPNTPTLTHTHIQIIAQATQAAALFGPGLCVDRPPSIKPVARIRQSVPNVGRIRPSSAQFGPNPAKLGQS